MKTLKHLIAAAALLVACSLTATAQQYAPSTILSIANTNVVGATTNVGALTTGPVTLTKWQDFALSVDVGVTNASAGTLDIQWDTSLDGVTYTTAKAMPGASGWFSVPLTNSTTRIYWTTNITLNAVGYFRVSWVTNQAGQHITNLVIKAYKKPARFGS